MAVGLIRMDMVMPGLRYRRTPTVPARRHHSGLIPERLADNGSNSPGTVIVHDEGGDGRREEQGELLIVNG